MLHSFYVITVSYVCTQVFLLTLVKNNAKLLQGATRNDK